MEDDKILTLLFFFFLIRWNGHCLKEVSKFLHVPSVVAGIVLPLSTCYWAACYIC